MTLSARYTSELLALEKAMWQESTRFDLAFQEARFAADFVEFGRSGRIYTRDQIISTDRSPIRATLTNFQVRSLDLSTVLLTYDSAAVFGGDLECAHRSSIWTRRDGAWQMRFHQGTPFDTSSLGGAQGAA